MGPMDISKRQWYSRGITGSSSKIGYLKLVSDFAGRNDGTISQCDKLIERVGEKLNAPRIVLLEASAIARRVLATDCAGRRMTAAAVSAYSLIAACKIAGITSLSS
jgi:hypothetical protein